MFSVFNNLFQTGKYVYNCFKMIIYDQIMELSAFRNNLKTNYLQSITTIANL